MGSICSGGVDLICPHVRCAPDVKQSDPEPLHGTLCWLPGGHVHHPGGTPIGDEYEPSPHFWVSVVSPGMVRVVDLFPRATPRHALGGRTVCALARRAPGTVRETAPSQQQALYFSLRQCGRIARGPCSTSAVSDITIGEKV